MGCMDTLESYTRPDGAFGVSNTQTVQKRFAQRLRGVLGRINGALTRAIVEDDIFNLKTEDDALAVDEPGPFDTTNNPTLIAQFIRWFQSQLDSEFLTVVGRTSNQFLRKAYAEGIRRANRELRDEDVLVQSENLDDVLSRPIHASALRRLATRTYGNLESLTQDMVPAVREQLVEGFAEGQNPRKIAREIRGRIDSIGKHRSTLIARSEIINAHSEASLNQYESVRDEEDTDIGLRHGDWQATPDNRTCPFCRRLSGATLSFEEMRNTRVEFRRQVYRLMPPSHPQGRCAVLPSIGVDTDDLPPLEERVPGTVI